MLRSHRLCPVLNLFIQNKPFPGEVTACAPACGSPRMPSLAMGLPVLGSSRKHYHAVPELLCLNRGLKVPTLGLDQEMIEV